MAPLESRIYLASQSPRRRELLAQVGIRFDLLLFRGDNRVDPETNEDPLPNEAPDTYALRVAAAKAQHGARLLTLRRLPERPVLSADTTLDFEGQIIGKPTDEADAIAILTRLSGQTHRVLTAIAVAQKERLETRLSVSEVRFRTISADEILRYVASGEPHDKAGAYGIQGRAALFVEEIRGSHSGIVGLPLCETALLLRAFGYPA
ncbi:MAG: Maf family protein [Rhodocyclaceae bacterium]|nr:Maf family protein [Rhodocyclaceae bacterium]MDZ4215988.1 Maf family protein [Rhodocyclaceae bacterium]